MKQYLVIKIFILCLLFLSSKCADGQSYQPYPKILKKDSSILMEIPTNYIGKSVLITVNIDHGFGYIGRPCYNSDVVTCKCINKEYITFIKEANHEGNIQDTPSLKRSTVSNDQSATDSFPIEYYNTDSTIVTINLSDKILQKNEWNQKRYKRIKQGLPNSTEIIDITNTSSINDIRTKSYFLKDASNSGTEYQILSGFLPLTYSYRFQWLPDNSMKMRLTHPSLPITKIVLHEVDCALEAEHIDSIACRWNPDKKFITINIDNYVPNNIKEAYNKAALYWNKILFDIDKKEQLFRLKVVQNHPNNASVYLYFDMGEPKVDVNNSIDTKTGEIVQSSINWGNQAEKYAVYDAILLQHSRKSANYQQTELYDEVLTNLAIQSLAEVFGIKTRQSIDYNKIVQSDTKNRSFKLDVMGYNSTKHGAPILYRNYSNILYLIYGEKDDDKSPRSEYENLMRCFKKGSSHKMINNYTERFQSVKSDITNLFKAALDGKKQDSNKRSFDYKDFNSYTIQLKKKLLNELIAFIDAPETKASDIDNIIAVINRHYFNISTTTDGIIDEEDNRMLKYTLKTLFSSSMYDHLLNNENAGNKLMKRYYTDINREIIDPLLKEMSLTSLSIYQLYLNELISNSKQEKNTDAYQKFIESELQINTNTLNNKFKHLSSDGNKLIINYLLNNISDKL